MFIPLERNDQGELRGYRFVVGLDSLTRLIVNGDNETVSADLDDRFEK